MSRSGYNDDGWESKEDQWAYICYRGALTSAIRGKNGQAFLKELLNALDAMPEKKLIAGELEEEGSFCALGIVGKNRGIKLDEIDPYDIDNVAKQFGINEKLAREIMYENDEGAWDESPETRWRSVRSWVSDNIKDVDTQRQAHKANKQ